MASPRAARRPNASYLKKEPSEVHEGFAGYITKTTGREVDGATVALVQRLYPLYLKTPEVVKARDAAKAAREAEAERKAEEKRQRLQERLDRIEAQRRKVLADLGIETEAEVVPLRPVAEVTEAEVEEAEDEFVVPEDDGEPEAEEVTVEEEDSEEEDLWDDEDDEDEEDF